MRLKRCAAIASATGYSMSKPVESWTDSDGKLTPPAFARINAHLGRIYKDRVCPSCGMAGPYNVDPNAVGLPRRPPKGAPNSLEVVIMVTCHSCGKVDLYSLGTLDRLLGTPGR